MLWITLAIASYFFSALSQTIDKIILHTRLPSPATYVFYTGIGSILVVILLPFDVSWLPLSIILLALISGAVFIPALYLLYFSLKRCDVSRIIPIVRGAIPIFLLFISFIWFGQLLGVYQLFAVILFIIGGLILAMETEYNDKTDTFFSHLFGMKGRRLKICNYETGKGIMAAVGSAFFFALTYFLSKQVYIAVPNFIPAFFWIRIGSAIGAFVLLFIPMFRREIFRITPTVSKSSIIFVFGNKIIGASGFFLLNLSCSVAQNQGYVIIINAMKGLEHLFVFIFSFCISIIFPKILYEEFDFHSIIIKLIGILFIGFGFVCLI